MNEQDKLTSLVVGHEKAEEAKKISLRVLPSLSEE